MATLLPPQMLPLFSGHLKLVWIQTKMMWQCDALRLKCGMKNLHITWWKLKDYLIKPSIALSLNDSFIDFCVHLIEFGRIELLYTFDGYALEWHWVWSDGCAS